MWWRKLETAVCHLYAVKFIIHLQDYVDNRNKMLR